MDPERAIEDARSVCADLRTLFEQPGGPESLEEVERLCEIGHLVIEDPRCRGELEDVRRYARFLMLGDHRRWARGSTSGRVHLRELILHLLRAVDVLLESLALNKRAARVRSNARNTRLSSEAMRARVRA